MSSPQPFEHEPAMGPSISWSLERPEVEAGTEQEIHCLIEIDGGPEPHRVRMPYDLALVVDRSGSMAGPAISLAKRMVARLLAKLEPEDRVALITYADVAELLVAITGSREEVLTLARDLEAAGDGDLVSALPLGIEALLAVSTDLGRERRVLLITDAEQQPGEEASGWLAQALGEARARRGITTVAIGLTTGLGSLLTRGLQRCGVAETASADTLERAPAAFAHVLPGVWEVAARRAVVEIAAAPGCRVRATHHGRDHQESDRLSQGALCRGERRRIVRSFRIPADGSVGMRTIGSIEVSYVPADAEEETSVRATVHVRALPAPLPRHEPDPAWVEAVGGIIKDDAIEAASGRSGRVPGDVLQIAAAELRALGASAHADALQELLDQGAAERARTTELLEWCHAAAGHQPWIEVDGVERVGWVSVEPMPASAAPPERERRRRLLMLSVARQAAAIAAGEGRRAVLRGHDQAPTWEPNEVPDFHRGDRRCRSDREAAPVPDAVVAWWSEHRGELSVRCALHGEIGRFDASRSIDMLGPAWDAAVIEQHDRWDMTRGDDPEEGCDVRIEPVSDPSANLLAVERMWLVLTGTSRPWWSYRRVGEDGRT